jgi:hypothetical protein
MDSDAAFISLAYTFAKQTTEAYDINDPKDVLENKPVVIGRSPFEYLSQRVFSSEPLEYKQYLSQ